MKRPCAPWWLALAAVLGCAEGDARGPGGPRWVELAQVFAPGPLPEGGVVVPWGDGDLRLSPGAAPGEARCALTIPAGSWRREGDGLWSAPLPAPALMPPPGARPRPASLELEGAAVAPFTGEPLRRVLEANLVGRFDESLEFLRRAPRPGFGLFEGRVYLLAGADGVAPGDGRLSHTLVLGERTDGRWRVQFEDLAADGLPVLPGQPARVTTDLAPASALRFGLVAVQGEGGPPGPVQVRVRLDGEVVATVEVRAAPDPVPSRHEVALGPRARAGARLSFEAAGVPAVTAVLHPVVGPADIGRRGERPWGAGRPDIVVVLGDTYRADNLSAWGGDPAIAPHLNRFAVGCRRFLAARAPATSTLPSHAAIFTGRYPPQCGVHVGEHRLSEDAVTLAEHLRDAGYRTAAVTDAGFVSWQYGLAQGFGSFEQSWSTDFEETLRATDRVLEADDGRPLFLFVQSYRAHNPYEASPANRRRLAGQYPLDGVHWDGLIAPVIGLRAAETRGAPLADPDGVLARFHDLYRVASADLDAGFGELLAMFQGAGLAGEGVLVFTSDHGEAFGAHGVIGHGRGVWEEEARVPLLIRAPGLPAGADVRDVSLVDLAPTLSSLAGVPPRGEWVGVDLLTEGARGGPIFSFTGSWTEDVVEVAAIGEGRKLILDAREGPGELRHAYRLDEDPGELHDERGEPWAEAVRQRLGDDVDAAFRGGGTSARPKVPARLRKQLDALGYTGAGGRR